METKGKRKYVDNTAKEVEAVAEKRDSKSPYQLNKVTISQFTLSGNVNNNPKKNFSIKKKLKKCYFQILTQQVSQDTSPMRLYSQS